MIYRILLIKFSQPLCDWEKLVSNIVTCANKKIVLWREAVIMSISTAPHFRYDAYGETCLQAEFL